MMHSFMVENNFKQRAGAAQPPPPSNPEHYEAEASEAEARRPFGMR
jgi:hypothetical protein